MSGTLRPPGFEERLTALRAEIDGLDDAIVPLLEARARVAIALGELKREAGRPLRDTPREAEILARLATHLNTLAPADLAAVYRAVMAMCLDVQTRALEPDDSPT
ncbi:chorismate mutase [Myxococcota bacterium]|nr:chorismate mutase [Myxococcota bacterium]